MFISFYKNSLTITFKMNGGYIPDILDLYFVHEIILIFYIFSFKKTILGPKLRFFEKLEVYVKNVQQLKKLNYPKMVITKTLITCFI